MRLHLKCESFQKTGSFKARGALNKILSLTAEERARARDRVRGNHARRWRRRRASPSAGVVVMPADAPRAKIDAVRGYAAEIVFHDNRRHAVRQARRGPR